MDRFKIDTMKALLCSSYGLPENLTFNEIASPAPSSDELVIDVHACGVNFPDLLFIQNKYQAKPPMPFSPGGEISGIVKSTGSNINQFKPGDRVIALCRWGGLAEQVLVKQHQVFPLPDKIDFIAGATTLYAFGTSYHALKDRGQLRTGQTLLVLGAASGVGLAAIELGKNMGALVIAAASTNEKLKICREKGANHLINYSKDDLRAHIKSIVGEKGVDVVYDAVGGKYSEPALRSMAWEGRFLVVGFASGEIPTFPANLPLLKGCSIVGVFWSTFADLEPEKSNQNFAQLLEWMKAGKIKQHIHHVYSFEESIKALQDLMNRKITGKAVVQVKSF
jgi:NADPH2:quinone reductase